MSKGEAERMFRRGLRFRVAVSLEREPENATAEKNLRIQALNNRYNGRQISFTRGFHTHEHHVAITGAEGKYNELCAALAGEPDGGIASAIAIRNWYTNEGRARLSHLTARQKMLAVLSHFSETSRGYGLTELMNFRKWINNIANASDAGVARDLWNRVKDVYPPSLTYAEDSRQDWLPPSSESSSDSDMDDEKMSEGP